MPPSLTYSLIAGILMMALWMGIYLVRDARPGDPFYIGLAALEVGFVGQLVVAVVAVSSTGTDASLTVLFGYLVANLVVLPAATLWSLGEPTRSGRAVLLVALLAQVVLQVRVLQIWVSGE